MGVSRRQVLAGLVAIPTAACTGLPQPGPAREPRPTAVVIGAGLAGMVAAHDLSVAGWDVTVLEASTAAGGRIRTVRDPAMPAGTYAEAGAEFVHPSHEHILTLAEQLSVLVDERPPRPEFDDVVCLQGIARRQPEFLTPDVQRTLDAAVQILVQLVDASAEDVPAVTALRSLPAETPLAGQTAVMVLNLMARRRHGFDLTDLSAAFVASGLAREITDPTMLRFRFGADSVITALARASEAQLLTSHVVEQIAQGPDEVVVTHSEGEATADRVIVALPMPLRQTLVGLSTVTTPVPAPSDETTVLMAYERPGWRRDDLSGQLWSDGPIGYAFDAGPLLADTDPGLLTVHSIGAQATQLRRLDETPGAVKGTIDECLPGDPLPPGRAAVVTDWRVEPFAMGGRPGFGPAAWANRGALAAPEGRVHFAGDYDGTNPGTLDAAVQSGRRAAQEVRDA